MKANDYKHKLKEYKDFLYPVFILILLLVLIYGFFLPKIKEIISFRKEIKNLENKVNQSASYLSYLQEIAASSLPVDEEVVNYALPPEKDIASLIVTFEGLGKVEGISLEPFNFKPGIISGGSKRDRVKKGSSFNPVEIAFDMKATAENEEAAKKLLGEILLARRILAIKSLRWSLDEKGRIKLGLSLSAYYLPHFSVEQSGSLAKRKEIKNEFLEKLKRTKVYEKEILEASPSGKENLFSL